MPLSKELGDPNPPLDRFGYIKIYLRLNKSLAIDHIDRVAFRDHPRASAKLNT